MIIIENTYACILSSEGSGTEHPPAPLAVVPTRVLCLGPLCGGGPHPLARRPRA